MKPPALNREAKRTCIIITAIMITVMLLNWVGHFAK